MPTGAHVLLSKCRHILTNTAEQSRNLCQQMRACAQEWLQLVIHSTCSRDRASPSLPAMPWDAWLS
jgi:hypothetical protein